MTVPSDNPAPASVASVRRIRMARVLVALACPVLALSLIGQVLTAGAAVFVDPSWWAVHAAAIHWFGWITVVILVLGFAGRLSRRFKVLSATVVFLVLIQYVTAGLSGSPSLGAGAALHPLTGFLLFWAVTELVRVAWAGRPV